MKKFLKTFAALAAGFAANNTIASTDNSLIATDKESDLLGSVESAHTSSSPEELNLTASSGDIFAFTLKRDAESGDLMAYHQSHASHQSHSSHRSHSSHYSSRY